MGKNVVRHKQFTNGTGRSGAAKYYTEHLGVSDYYANGFGLLRGQVLQHLGLSSTAIDLERFVALEKNIHPETGEQLTPRTNGSRQEWGVDKSGRPELKTVDNRRTGLDLPFVVPKTLSEVMAENPGEWAGAIERVCVAAKERGMSVAESLAKAHVRIGGAMEERSSGNLLYLSVIHRDARPVGSHVPDPMWHSHNFIFNLTFDPIEKRLKTVELHDVIKHADTIDAAFLSELERGLTKLGIGTDRTPDGRSFEIASVKGKEIFCKRRNEILKEELGNRDRIETLTRYRLRAAAKLGKVLDYDRVKTEVRNELGKQIAKRKVVIGMEEKLEKLREQMTPEIRASLQKDAVTSAPRVNWRTPDEAKVEVLHSAFKQQSVVHELDIAGQLLRATGGAMTFEESLKFAKGPAFIHLDDDGHVTTEAVKREEERMLKTVQGGQDMFGGIVLYGTIKDPQVLLARDQENAVKFIWNSNDLVTDVSGIAGAGKTTMLKEAVREILASDRNVILLAPTSASEKNLQKDFLNPMTLQKFDTDLECQRNLRSGDVIILDESSMVSVPQMCRLVALVKERKCRLVTLGDSDQHVSPERGDAIRILQDSGSVRSVELTETYRAKVAYLKATIEDLKAGGDRRAIGYARLEKHGDIREVTSLHDMRQQAVDEHLAAVRAGYLAILASPVHAEAREATAIVRETLKVEGLIEKEDHAVTRLSRVNVAGPELKDPLHYQTGRVVAFHTKVMGGFKSGEKWRVLSCLDDCICPDVALERNGVTKLFNPQSKGKWSVYDAIEMQLAVGDQVRITEGFKERGVVFKNNDISKVSSIADDRITLDDGRCMSRDFLHLNQGHCITSYATQCRTVRQVTALCPLSSFAELDAKTFYVLASRATHRAVFFTDCKEAFKEAVLRPGDRKSVWDYVVTPVRGVQPLLRSRSNRVAAQDMER
jgi:conjugative relaxase-like TrwC/TraI family protein